MDSRSQATNPFVKKEYFLTVSKTAKHGRASLFLFALNRYILCSCFALCAPRAFGG